MRMTQSTKSSGRTLAVTFSLVSALTLSACAQQFVSMPESELTEQEAAATEAPTASEIQKADSEISAMVTPSLSATQKQKVLAKYAHLDPKHIIPDGLLENAVLYFDANLGNFPNRNYLGVYDYSLRSTKARFYVVNLKTGSVWAVWSAHGKGSDANHDGFAEKFSNASGSNASSLGFAKTVETYQSAKFGYALRMKGLSTTNSNIYKRAVVIHGANYVSDREVVQGRSYGCPAVAYANRDKLINQLKGGALIYFGLSQK